MSLKSYKPGSLRYRFRMARFKIIKKVIDNIQKNQPRVRILDLGGTAEYWKTLFPSADASDIQITVLNTAEAQPQDGMFVPVCGDACAVDAPDNSFDFVHSNSVIEHVGAWSNQVRMAQEIRRLAPNYYIQTPYMWFPFEQHFHAWFFHWWPEHTRARILMKKNLGFMSKAATIEEAHMALEHHRLIDLTQFRELFPDARIRRERVLGLTKSLIAVRDQTQVQTATGPIPALAAA